MDQFDQILIQFKLTADKKISLDFFGSDLKFQFVLSKRTYVCTCSDLLCLIMSGIKKNNQVLQLNQFNFGMNFLIIFRIMFKRNL